MNQTFTTTSPYILTDAMWAKVEVHFTGNLYNPRSTRKVLETILYLAQSNSGWTNWVHGMPGKSTLQKYIHIFHNRGTLSKILSTLNRGATEKIQLSNVLALLSANRKTKNSKVTVAKKVPTKSSMSIEDAIELVLEKRDYTSFIKSQIFDEVKAIVPKVHALTVYANIQKRIRYGTLHGSLDSMIYKPYPESMMLYPASPPAVNITKPVETAVYKDDTDNVQDNEVTYKHREPKVVKEDVLSHGWNTFLEVYAKAHWTQKKKMAQKIRNWLVSN